MRALILALLLTISFSSNTSAQELTHPDQWEGAGWVVPSSEWTPEARRWTIVAMIAESGFLRDRYKDKERTKLDKRGMYLHKKEQAILVHILAKRYKTRKAFCTKKPTAKGCKGGNIKYVDIVRDFCNGLKKIRKYNLTLRQGWLWGLNVNDLTHRPKHFPKRLNWELHAMWLQRTIDLIDRWIIGRVPDPCPRARTWGAKSDPIKSPRAYPLHMCTWKKGNILYGIKPRGK